MLLNFMGHMVDTLETSAFKLKLRLPSSRSVLYAYSPLDRHRRSLHTVECHSCRWPGHKLMSPERPMGRYSEAQNTREKREVP